MRQKNHKQRVKEFGALLPKLSQGVLNMEPGVSMSSGAYSPMKKGNRLAAKENLEPEAHEKRMSALFKSWGNSHRRYRGEKIMTHKAKKKASVTKRRNKRAKIILEYRQLMERVRLTAPDVLEEFEKMLNSANTRDADKIAIGQVLLDRGYGKANQPNINMNIDANGSPADISDKELNERIAEALKRVEDLTGRERKADPSKDKPADIRERDGDTGGSTLH